MNKSTILKMISKGESLTVEFKHGSITDISAIYRVMCAFANSKGGHIILGVDDNGTIVGCESKCVDVIKKLINEKHVDAIVSPAITPEITIFDIDSKIIICISVVKSKIIHRFKGKTIYRINELDVSEETAFAYKKINQSGVYNFLMHSDGSEISSYEAAFRILEPFKDWVENHKGWRTILNFPTLSREKEIQRLIDLKGRDFCQSNNIDMSFEANEGPGPVDLKLSRGNDKTVIEIKLSSNEQYLHGFEVQVEEYAKAENTQNRIYVYIQVGNPGRDKKIKELYQIKQSLGENPPFLFMIDSQERKSASKS